MAKPLRSRVLFGGAGWRATSAYAQHDQPDPGDRVQYLFQRTQGFDENPQAGHRRQNQDCIRDDDPDHHQETVMETGRQRAGDHPNSAS